MMNLTCSSKSRMRACWCSSYQCLYMCNTKRFPSCNVVIRERVNNAVTNRMQYSLWSCLLHCPARCSSCYCCSSPALGHWCKPDIAFNILVVNMNGSLLPEWRTTVALPQSEMQWVHQFRLPKERLIIGNNQQTNQWITAINTALKSFALPVLLTLFNPALFGRSFQPPAAWVLCTGGAAPVYHHTEIQRRLISYYVTTIAVLGSLTFLKICCCCCSCCCCWTCWSIWLLLFPFAPTYIHTYIKTTMNYRSVSTSRRPSN